MRYIPRPGMERLPPLLVGGVLSTGPPGKSLNSPLLYLEAKQYSVNLLRTPMSKGQGA